jgi:lambda repressor-like predicted transcriptional regulator
MQAMQNKPTRWLKMRERELEMAIKRQKISRRSSVGKEIFRWKNASSRFYERLESLFHANPPEFVATILKRVREIVDAGGDAGDAVAELLKLNGVQVPTASAVLANVYPEKFTVIDQLALRALGVNDQAIAFYRYYNNECHRLASENGVSIRTLDRALWEWGKTNPPRRTRP